MDRWRLALDRQAFDNSYQIYWHLLFFCIISTSQNSNENSRIFHSFFRCAVHFYNFTKKFDSLIYLFPPHSFLTTLLLLLQLKLFKIAYLYKKCYLRSVNAAYPLILYHKTGDIWKELWEEKKWISHPFLSVLWICCSYYPALNHGQEKKVLQKVDTSPISYLTLVRISANGRTRNICWDCFSQNNYCIWKMINMFDK